MKISSVKEMQQIDREAGELYDYPEILLMENAGRAVFQAAEDLLAGVAGKNICVLAGSGNNGGDAFVTARYLLQHGAKVRLFFLGQADHLKESAAKNYQICRRLGLTLNELQSEHDWEKLALVLQLSHAVIDGLLGTGFASSCGCVFGERRPHESGSHFSRRFSGEWHS